MNWQSIISEHGPMVWKTAFRLLGNEADTSDCFQDIFLTAVQVARREKIRHLPALLNRLATHKAIDLLRLRMQTPKTTPSMDCDEFGAAHSHPPAEQLRQIEPQIQQPQTSP